MTCPIGTNIQHAVRLLRSGELVAFPTETVYGLGGNAFDPGTIARLFDVKQRPRFDPLIVHVADITWLEQLAADVPDLARRLAEQYWPGPLTLVLSKTCRVPDLVTSGLPSVAIRIPEHPLAIELLRACNLPLAAPSANRFGRLSPTRAEHVAEQLGERIAYILDGGPSRIGVESTVLDLTVETPRLLRPGGLPLEELETVAGPVRVWEPDRDAGGQPQPSPGMLPKHYAPQTPLTVCESVPDGLSGKRVGLLTLQAPSQPASFAAVEVLSDDGDLQQAAARFFQALRALDACDLDVIVAHPLPNQGLGRAMNDRLRRAAHDRRAG